MLVTVDCSVTKADEMSLDQQSHRVESGKTSPFEGRKIQPFNCSLHALYAQVALRPQALSYPFVW